VCGHTSGEQRVAGGGGGGENNSGGWAHEKKKKGLPFYLLEIRGKGRVPRTHRRKEEEGEPLGIP